MPLYCYIIETGMYEDVEAHILGHTNKYSQDEFDKLCIEITEKHGDVEEIAYFSSYDTSDVEEIKYNIPAEKLIEYLIKDYGFIELDVPINNGHNSKEVSRTPVPPEDLTMITIESHGKCPMDGASFYAKKEDLLHPNARCSYGGFKID